MIRWNGIAPLPRETEAEILHELCLLHVAMLNPCATDPERGNITRRCQHCQNIFQQSSDKRMQLYCAECR